MVFDFNSLNYKPGVSLIFWVKQHQSHHLEPTNKRGKLWKCFKISFHVPKRRVHEPTPPLSCNFTQQTLFHFHCNTLHPHNYSILIKLFLLSLAHNCCTSKYFYHHHPLLPPPPPPPLSSSSLQSILFCCQCSVKKKKNFLVAFRHAEDADASSSQQHKATTVSLFSNAAEEYWNEDHQHFRSLNICLWS